MISAALLNLIVSIVAVGILVAVLRAAYLVAGSRSEEVPVRAAAEVVNPIELERAA
jgi:hypothetical protein